MLKLKKTEKGYEVTRIATKNAFFTNGTDFINNLCGFADSELLASLTIKKTDTPEEEEEKAEKMDAIDSKTVDLYDKTDRLAKATTIGLHWCKPSSILKEFIPVWDIARKYAKAYKECTDWNDSRKADFINLRNTMIDCYKTVAKDSGYEIEKLNIPSKDVNAFVDKLYTITVKNIKGVSGSKYIMVKCEKGFQYYMESMNHAVGIRHEEGKTKELKVF